MKSVIILTIFLLGANAADNCGACKSAKAEVKVVESIARYLNVNPNITLTELQETRNLRLNQNVYTLGARRAGDRLVAIDNGWAQYPWKQNLELRIWYPVTGSGAVITYIQIVIAQDNGTFGRGYVVWGGIGQRNIQVLVEAWNTAYIKYDYSIFGI